jgi:hypothetical protein
VARMIVTMKSGRAHTLEISGDPIKLGDSLGKQLGALSKDTSLFFWTGAHVFMLDAVESVVFEDKG